MELAWHIRTVADCRSRMRSYRRLVGSTVIRSLNGKSCSLAARKETVWLLTRPRVLVNADNPSLAIDTSIRVVLVVSRDVRIGWHRPRSARATA